MPRSLFRSTFPRRLFIDFQYHCVQLAQPGSRIVVPLGRKIVTGYIVGLLDESATRHQPAGIDIKDAKEILDVFRWSRRSCFNSRAGLPNIIWRRGAK